MTITTIVISIISTYISGPVEISNAYGISHNVTKLNVQLTKPAEVEAVVVKVPVVSQLYLIDTDRSQHHEQDDWQRTERRHADPGTTHHVCYHGQLVTHTHQF